MSTPKCKKIQKFFYSLRRVVLSPLVVVVLCLYIFIVLWGTYFVKKSFFFTNWVSVSSTLPPFVFRKIEKGVPWEGNPSCIGCLRKEKERSATYFILNTTIDIFCRYLVSCELPLAPHHAKC